MIRKKIISVASAAACLISAASAALIPAAADAADGIENIVILGDSISSGYGLANPDCSYAKLTADYFGANCTDYSQDGFKTGDLLSQIQTDQTVKDSLATADVILITIGGNDILAPVLEFVEEYIVKMGIDPSQIDLMEFMDKFNPDDYPDIFETDDPKQELVDKLNEKLTGEMISEMKSNFKSISSELTNYPDAVICFQHLYNPMDIDTTDWTAKAADRLSQINLKMNAGVHGESITGYVYQVNVNGINNGIKRSRSSNQYTVDVVNSFASHGELFTNIMNLDIHPNQLGAVDAAAETIKTIEEIKGIETGSHKSADSLISKAFDSVPDSQKAVFEGLDNFDRLLNYVEILEETETTTTAATTTTTTTTTTATLPFISETETETTTTTTTGYPGTMTSASSTYILDINTTTSTAETDPTETEIVYSSYSAEEIERLLSGYFLENNIPAWTEGIETVNSQEMVIVKYNYKDEETAMAAVESFRSEYNINPLDDIVLFYWAEEDTTETSSDKPTDCNYYSAEELRTMMTDYFADNLDGIYVKVLTIDEALNYGFDENTAAEKVLIEYDYTAANDIQNAIDNFVKQNNMDPAYAEDIIEHIVAEIDSNPTTEPYTDPTESPTTTSEPVTTISTTATTTNNNYNNYNADEIYNMMLGYIEERNEENARLTTENGRAELKYYVYYEDEINNLVYDFIEEYNINPNDLKISLCPYSYKYDSEQYRTILNKYFEENNIPADVLTAMQTAELGYSDDTVVIEYYYPDEETVKSALTNCMIENKIDPEEFLQIEHLIAEVATDTTTTTTTTTKSTTSKAATTTTTTKATTSKAATSATTATTKAPTTSSQTGDVNGDGTIDSKDASMILVDYANALLGKKSEIDAKLADINGDGAVDSKDATALLVYYAKAILDNGYKIDVYLDEIRK